MEKVTTVPTALALLGSWFKEAELRLQRALTENGELRQRLTDALARAENASEACAYWRERALTAEKGHDNG